MDGLVNDMNGMETLLDEVKDWHWKIIAEPGDHPGRHNLPLNFVVMDSMYN